jgi:hypothetical protein
MLDIFFGAAIMSFIREGVSGDSSVGVASNDEGWKG